MFDLTLLNTVIAACEKVGCLVVVDEAYFAFASLSYLPHVVGKSNVVLMRTVSKLGLAGLRLGMLFGAPAWLREFEKVRLPYNINVFTQVAATFALNNYAAFLNQAAQLKVLRAQLARDLAQLPGLTVFASEANFLLVRVSHATLSVAQVFEALKAKKILVKNTSSGHALLANTLRISVGTEAENAALLSALTQIFNPTLAVYST